MKIRIFLAVLICKLSRFAIRLLGRGGTDYPGRFALSVYPELPAALAKNLKVVIVTGTNGKTTTSRMLERCMEKAGLSYFANRSGANLLSGITAELCANSTLFGRNKKEYALIECDEAAFRRAGLLLNPVAVVVTNVFRDQLDRYGEITHTRNSLLIGIKNSPNAVVCINADCSLSASLSDEISNKVLYFGIEGELYERRVEEVSDALYCIRCKTRYEYTYHTFGHLGGFHCPACGYSRPDTFTAVEEVLENCEDHTVIRLRIGEELHTVSVNLPGGYNVYNAAACATAATVLGIPSETIVSALGDFEGGFGRMETFKINEASFRMILVKNPAGCNQVLNYLSNLKSQAVFAIALNDRAADGTDISWIWDVDFEKIVEIDLKKIYITGIRADELAVRLKYAGIDGAEIIRDYHELLETISHEVCPVFIMPTYTAMLDIREVINKTWGCKNFWE